MNDVIFSTRGTKTAKILMYILPGVMLLLMAFFNDALLSGASSMYIFMPKNYKRTIWGISLITSVLPACCGTFMLIYACKCALTYADVYRDKFVGKGLPKLSMLANPELFTIQNEQIINVTMIRCFFMYSHTQRKISHND